MVSDQFVVSRAVLMQAAFVDKMVSRRISPAEVDAVLERNEVFDVVPGRRRYGLVGIVDGRPLHLWVADDGVEDATGRDPRHGRPFAHRRAPRSHEPV